MKRIALSIALVQALLGAAAAEVVRTKERHYAVRFKDDAVERYQVVWRAHSDSTMRDQGGSLIPYQGAVETRRCAWEIVSTIDRTVALATRLGPAMPIPALSRMLKADPQKQEERRTVKGSAPDACNAVGAQREADERSARAELLRTFEQITEADLATLRREAESRADVVSVTVQ